MLSYRNIHTKSGRTIFRDKIYNNLQSTNVKKIPRISSLGAVGSNAGMIGNIIIDKSTSLFCYHNGLKWVCVGNGDGVSGPTGPQGVQGPTGASNAGGTGQSPWTVSGGNFIQNTNYTDQPVAFGGNNLIFGSNTLNYSSPYSARLLFTVNGPTGAFRAGATSGNQWDSSNRGQYSVAFGLNNMSAGTRAFIGAGQNNTTSSTTVDTFIGGGNANLITANCIGSIIVGGSKNNINSVNSTDANNYAFIGGGFQNTIYSNGTMINSNRGAFIGGGIDNNITSIGGKNVCKFPFIVGGIGNQIISKDSNYGCIYAGILGGIKNYIRNTNSDYGEQGATINGGLNNTMTLLNGSGITYSIINGGSNNRFIINNSEAGNWSAIIGGRDNTINSEISLACASGTIVHGYNNLVYTKMAAECNNYGVISGGRNVIISSYNNSTLSGNYCMIGDSTGSAIYCSNSTNSNNYSTVLGGRNNRIGGNKIMNSQRYVLIGGGYQNVVYSKSSIDCNRFTIVGNGFYNRFYANFSTMSANRSMIGNGLYNQIHVKYSSTSSANYSTIGNGSYNRIYANNAKNSANNSVIVCGLQNTINSNNSINKGNACFIGSGSGNTIYANFSAILIGQNNNIPAYDTVMNPIENSSVTAGIGLTLNQSNTTLTQNLRVGGAPTFTNATGGVQFQSIRVIDATGSGIDQTVGMTYEDHTLIALPDAGFKIIVDLPDSSIAIFGQRYYIKALSTESPPSEVIIRANPIASVIRINGLNNSNTISSLNDNFVSVTLIYTQTGIWDIID